ncbi:MAG: hypothetical protein KGK07_07230 [Chloroflexota bacterium]|nr:hypothetical protein [Chloroflexota bacterium]
MGSLLTGSVDPLLLGLLKLALVAAIGYVAPRAVRWLDAHTTAQQRTLLGSAARDAVLWAEQFAGPAGNAKFQAAVARLNVLLGRYGFTAAEIEGAVQAAWAAAKAQGLLNAPAQPAAPPAVGKVGA